jgi:hypothetical protein
MVVVLHARHHVCVIVLLVVAEDWLRGCVQHNRGLNVS